MSEERNYINIKYQGLNEVFNLTEVQMTFHFVRFGNISLIKKTIVN